MDSKKGAIPFSITLVIMMTLLLIYAWMQLENKYSKFNRSIGERQYELMNVYQKAESSLLYIDQSAKYSLEQAVYELAQDGGISEIDISDNGGSASYKCGKFKGAYVWYTLKKEGLAYTETSCINENEVSAHLLYLFNKNLNQYLLAYPDDILIDNYNYELKPNLEIIGHALSPLTFDVLKKGKKETIEDKTKAMRGEVSREPTKTADGLVDFTGTEPCAKGSNCVLTEEALKLIKNAQEIAKQKGVFLEVYSAYRSLERQKALWEGNTPERYAQRYPDEGERRKYVCYPYGNDAEQRCPHLSGNAVDVRLKTKSMTSEEWSMLHEIMASAGWVRYANEPWHFECCGTARYARAKERGVTAIA